MAVNKRGDPYLGFRFLVEIEGMEVGGFSEVSGLQVEVEVEDYREGGCNEFVHKLVGSTRYPANLTLKHGLMDATKLWDWHQKVRNGQIERKNGSILLMDSAGSEVCRWNFTAAHPVRWSGPDLRANTADVALESIELVHCGLALAK